MVRYARANESVYSDLPVSMNSSTNNGSKSPLSPPRPKLVANGVHSEPRKSESSNSYQYIETDITNSYVEVDGNEYEDTPFLSGVILVIFRSK